MSEPGDGTPFAAACAARTLDDGTFAADLRQEWSIGTHPHGGFLLALLARAAIARLVELGEPPYDPLVVSVEFLRPPAIGPVLLHTDVRKLGRRTTVVAVRLAQRGRDCVEARVTVGALPTRKAAWSELPPVAQVPPSDARTLSGETGEGAFNLAKDCDVRIDPATAGYLTGRTGDPPRMRLWVRPRHGEPDPYFALLAADINPPVVFNLGPSGWAPTAQLTAYLRSHPAPGWLRVHVDCRAVYGGWFDSDATVIDSRGRLVCQARQLALLPAS